MCISECEVCVCAQVSVRCVCVCISECEVCVCAQVST